MLKMVDSTHTDTCIVYEIPNESKGMVQLGSAWLGSLQRINMIKIKVWDECHVMAHRIISRN